MELGNVYFNDMPWLKIFGNFWLLKLQLHLGENTGFNTWNFSKSGLTEFSEKQMIIPFATMFSMPKSFPQK